MIYPNPATDYISIKGVSVFDRYNIYDMSGRMITSGNLNSKDIDIRNLSAGKYILALHASRNANAKQVMTSFIKNNVEITL